MFRMRELSTRLCGIRAENERVLLITAPALHVRLEEAPGFGLDVGEECYHFQSETRSNS